MIVLFDTNAIMKIKLKYRQTFILNRKTKQEKGKDTKEFVFKEMSGSHTRLSLVLSNTVYILYLYNFCLTSLDCSLDSTSTSL